MDPPVSAAEPAIYKTKFFQCFCLDSLDSYPN
jgi:hypothetical protein